MGASFDPYHKWLGIPPSEQPPNYYRLLGINVFEEDPEVIQAAADRQMGHVRTYQLGQHSDASQRLLNELAAALVCLSDSVKKAEYDARLRADVAEKAAEQAEPEFVPAEVVGTEMPPLGWMVRGAARYSVIQLRRLWIYQTRLESAFWRLGLEVYHTGRYREYLKRFYDRLETPIDEPGQPEPAAEQAPVGPHGPLMVRNRWEAAKARTQSGVQAMLAARRRAAMFRSLGRAAYEIDGLSAGPRDLTEPIREHLTELAQLRSQVAELSEIPPGYLLSPRQLAWLFAAMLVFAVSLYALLSWTL